MLTPTLGGECANRPATVTLNSYFMVKATITPISPGHCHLDPNNWGQRRNRWRNRAVHGERAPIRAVPQCPPYSDAGATGRFRGTATQSRPAVIAPAVGEGDHGMLDIR
jgi:hypothetical protein